MPNRRNNVEAFAHGIVENADLVGGLVCTDTAKFMRAVCRQQNQGDAGMAGLKHSRVNVGHRGARGRDDHRWLTRGQRAAESNETERALIQSD